jgi:glutamate-1-semialdehyde 2,1-aminomutase
MNHDRSLALYHRACAVMPGGSTRSTVHERPFPIYADSGEGAYVRDVDGNRYLDFTNNFTTLIHGYHHPSITEALAAQIHRGVSFGNPTETEIELAELLCERISWFDHIRFTNTGSEAVMMAVRASRARNGRPKVAKCEGAFHGNYDPMEVSFDSGPLNWGGGDPARVAYSRGTPQAVLQQTVVLPFNDLEATARILAGEADELSCVVIDPMPARAGLIPASREYLAFVREFTHRHGIALISDEVLNFRLSYEGAMTRFGVEPDLCTFGKIIGGGMPIGAVAGKAEMMSVFDSSRDKPAVPQAGTFTANPLSMVAGTAAMRAMTREAFARLDALGEAAREGLRAAIGRTGVPAQVTGLGSLFQIKLNDRRLRGYRDQYPDPGERARLTQFVRVLRESGVLISSTGLGALSTPMTTADIALLVQNAERALTEIGA